MMRSGPKPLPFQLGMASLASAGLAGGEVFDAQTLQDFFRGIQKYQAYDFNVPYIQSLFSFFGVKDITVFRAEGLNVPIVQEKAFQKGVESIAIA